METIAKFLKDNHIFYLATTEGDQPRVRPFGAVCVHDGKLYISTANQKPVSAQMKVNPKVEISATTPDGGTWLRLTAQAVPHDSRDARQAMLNAVPALAGRYSADDGIFEVFYLQNATGIIQPRSGQSEIHQF